MYPPCLHSVSTSSRNSYDSGDKEETKWILVSTLSPLCDDSELFREVLRLGLEGTNPGISLTPLGAIKKNLCIEALPFECGKMGWFAFGCGSISTRPPRIKAYWIYSLAAKIAAAAKEKSMVTAAQLIENTHQGFEGLKASLCLASMEAKSNTAFEMPVCLWQNGIRSRSSGKERDQETGLDYFGARYYSGAQGRWTSPDEPFEDQFVNNPQSWNLYSYVRNNPIARIDSQGRGGLEAVANSAEEFFEQSPPMIRPYILPAVGVLVGAAWVSTHWDDIKAALSNYRDPQEQWDQSLASHFHPTFYSQEQGRDSKGKFLPKEPGQAKPGSTDEQNALDAVGATKNTKPLENGRIPDGNKPDGQKVEVKSGGTVANTKQVKEMAQGSVDETGKPLKVVTTNPKVKITKPVQQNPNIEIEKLDQK
jgi:RHS repeat-associated protein